MIYGTYQRLLMKQGHFAPASVFYLQVADFTRLYAELAALVADEMAFTL